MGVNSRLDAVQAVVLRAKLARLEAWNERRRRAARRYDRLLADVPGVRRPRHAPGNEHVWHLYVVRVAERDRVLAALHDAGVGAGIHYPTPVHLTGAYAGLGMGPGSCPVAERAAGEMISLPMYPHLAAEAQDHVVDALAGARAARGAPRRAEPAGDDDRRREAGPDPGPGAAAGRALRLEPGEHGDGPRGHHGDRCRAGAAAGSGGVRHLRRRVRGAPGRCSAATSSASAWRSCDGPAIPPTSPRRSRRSRWPRARCSPRPPGWRAPWFARGHGRPRGHGRGPAAQPVRARQRRGGDAGGAAAAYLPPGPTDGGRPGERVGRRRRSPLALALGGLGAWSLAFGRLSGSLLAARAARALRTAAAAPGPRPAPRPAPAVVRASAGRGEHRRLRRRLRRPGAGGRAPAGR